jgi:hypothetical protein
MGGGIVHECRLEYLHGLKHEDAAGIRDGAVALDQPKINAGIRQDIGAAAQGSGIRKELGRCKSCLGLAEETAAEPIRGVLFDFDVIKQAALDTIHAAAVLAGRVQRELTLIDAERTSRE